MTTWDDLHMDENMGSWFATIFWICGIFAPTGGSLSRFGTFAFFDRERI